MKKCVILFVAMMVSVGLLFSQGVYEKDYDEFWKILDDYYPGTVLAEKDGLDLKALEEGGREQVKNAKSVEEFALILRNIANKFTYIDYIDIALGSNGGENIGLSQNAPSHQYIPSIKTVVFSVKSLLFGEEYLSEVINGIEEVEHIVFDLTSCSSITSNLDPILSPFGGSWTYTYKGYAKSEEIAASYPDIVVSKTDESSKAYGYGLKTTLQRTVEYEYGEGTIEGKAKDAKRWILVGNLTGFGADYLASFAKETGWATVVGTRSPGNGTGLPFCSFTLPNTNIVVSFNPIVLDDGKGDLKTKTGNMPDVLAKGGKSALSVCIEMIENN